MYNYGSCSKFRDVWLARIGCKLLLYPGAFNITTGPRHWELLIRGLLVNLFFHYSEIMVVFCRATNNQLFVAGISPARDLSASYIAWGHSMLCNPWYGALTV